MTRATKIIGKVRRGVQNVAYGNPLYQKILAAGESPTRLHFTPADLWPGDAAAGQAFLSGQKSMFDRDDGNGHVVPLRHAASTLRNLRAVGTDAAQRACVRLIDNWLQQFDIWDETEWQSGNAGARIATWIGFYDFYAAVAPPEFTQRLVFSIHRQWKHLSRTIELSLTSVDALQAARGLIYGGLNFPDGDKALGLACDLLQRRLAAEILPDGGHVSRNPSAQLHILRHLVDIRNVFDLADIRLPDAIGATLTTMIPALRFHRHGDGGLAFFHGAINETPLLIDAVLTQAAARGRALRRLPETGYERLTAGRSLLLVDAASPPSRAYGAEGHAGLLAFEFSVGRERIIVNCGSVPHASSQWRAACAATAAHSTVTVSDTNACDLDDDGGIAGNVMTSTQRFEEEESHGLEMAHDGYRPRFGLMIHRILRLSTDGDTLTGRDVLQGKAGHPFAIRWHLYPDIVASISHGGQTALLRTASGSGWRLRVESATLALESSIFARSAAPCRTMQLKAMGLTGQDKTVINWTLTRERRG